MKIYLDDLRPTPAGWVRCMWPDEVIKLLLKHEGEVTHLSLDNDLGDDEKGQGKDVVDWLEEMSFLGRITPPENITVHSANQVRQEYMLRGIENIKRYAQQIPKT